MCQIKEHMRLALSHLALSTSTPVLLHLITAWHRFVGKCLSPHGQGAQVCGIKINS